MGVGLTPSGRRCPSCAAPLLADDLYCRACGTPTPTHVISRDEWAAVPQLESDDAALVRRVQKAVGDGFRVSRLLGQGGFGSVYAAHDLKLERDVAVKVLRPDALGSHASVERFQREARTIAQLRHPGIVPVYQVGEGEGLVWFVMPLIRGESIRSLLVQQKRVPVPEVRRILAETARALAAAHEAGVIHRDIKPENVMLEGWERRVQLMDFGISRSFHESKDSGLTEQGMIIGTVDYMSPEQASGTPIDHRSDIYSLGVVGYEMLAGKAPFAGDTPRQVLTRVIVDEPPNLAGARPDVPPDLAAAVMRCLAKDPSARWISAQELAQALEERIVPGGLTRLTPVGPARLTPAARAPASGPVAPLAPVTAVAPAQTRPSARTGARLRDQRIGLTLVAAVLVVVNWLETTVDNWIGARSRAVIELRHQAAHAMQWLEGHLSFAGHDATNALALYGYTVSYFFLFPALLVGIAVSLARRPTAGPYRLLVSATVIDYALSLPFFLFLPVPERWAFPESGAVLLSDRWSSYLIMAIRPMSGLDNCFPSSHTSLSVVAVLVAFTCGMRLRWAALALGLAVVGSTFVLGIHWIADIVGGLAVGILSTAIALRLEARRQSRLLAPASVRSASFTEVTTPITSPSSS